MPEAGLLPREYLDLLADEMDKAERVGFPYGSSEGERYIYISDELAKEIAANLRKIAQEIRESNHA